MPIFFPDILENNNPNFPLVDATFLKGNSYPLASIDATGSIPSDKRNVGLIVFDSGSQEFYAYKGTTVADWNVSSNWVRFGSADIALVTASISDATITFEKGDGSTFDLTVDNVESSSYAGNATSASHAQNTDNAISSSYAVSSSVTDKAFIVDSNLPDASTALVFSYGTGYTGLQTDGSHISYNPATNVLDLKGTLIVTGSVSASSFTGSLLGTASYAAQALTASYANTATSASHALNANNAISSSYALSASYAATATSASHALNANNAISSSYAATATSASHALNANNAVSASYASTATSASHALNANNAISASYSLSSSYSATATSASHALNANTAISASYAATATSASHALNANNAISASYAATSTSASHALNSNNAISASYATNADNLDGQDGSYYRNADNINAGTLNNSRLPSAINVTSVTASFKGNLDGNAATATSSSHALNANNAISASYAATATTANSATTAGSANTATSASHAIFADSAGSSGTASSVDFSNITNKPALVSSSAQIDLAQATGTAATATSASHAVYADTANSAITAGSTGFATSASYTDFALSASHALNANNATSASYSATATSASHALNANTAISASYAATATSASHALNANNAISSSYAATATSASHALNANNAISASYSLSSSYSATATSASHALNADNAISASYALSSSYAVSSSYAGVTDRVNLSDAVGNNIYRPLFVDAAGNANEPLYATSDLIYNPSKAQLVFTYTGSLGGTNTFYLWPGLEAGSPAVYSVGLGINTLTNQAVAFDGTSHNVAIGTYSQRNNLGRLNTTLGSLTLEYTESDDNESNGNIAVGYEALNNSGEQFNNYGIAIGYQANQVGGTNYDIAIGYHALYNGVTTAFGGLQTNNIALGKRAMVGGAGGTRSFQNIAIGYEALASPLSNAEGNIAIGTNAGDSVSTGDNNVLIGTSAGGDITTGVGNIVLGGYTGKSATQNNNIAISDGNANLRIFVTGSNGDTGVGTDNPLFKLDVNGTLGASLSTAADNSNIVSWNSTTDEIQYTPSMSIDTNAYNPSGSGGTNTKTYLVLNDGYSISNKIEYGYFERTGMTNSPPQNFTLLTIPQTTYHSIVIDYTTSDSSYAFTRSQRFICHWDNGTGISFTNSGAPDLGSINASNILSGAIVSGNIQIRLFNYLSSGRIIGDYKLFKKI